MSSGLDPCYWFSPQSWNERVPIESGTRERERERERHRPKMVLEGLVEHWFLAASPTKRWVWLKATQDGVVRLPWSLGMISMRLCCITPTHEYVVPKSIPMAMASSSLSLSISLPLSVRVCGVTEWSKFERTNSWEKIKGAGGIQRFLTFLLECAHA